MKKYVSTVLKMEVENPGDLFIVYGFGEIERVSDKNLCKFERGLFYNKEEWKDIDGEEMYVFDVHESMEEAQEYIIQRLFVVSR